MGRQIRRKTILPKNILLSLAEQQKKDQSKNKNQQDESESEEEEIEVAPPPKKKPAISKVVDGIEVQVQPKAYKKSVVNNSAKDFLKQHFYGNRVNRPTFDDNIVKNGMFAKNI